MRIKKLAVATSGRDTGNRINAGAGWRSGSALIIIEGTELIGRGLSSPALLKGIFCRIGDEIAVEVIKFSLSIL